MAFLQPHGLAAWQGNTNLYFCSLQPHTSLHSETTDTRTV